MQMPVAKDQLKLFQSIEKEWTWKLVVLKPKTPEQIALVENLWPKFVAPIKQ